MTVNGPAHPDTGTLSAFHDGELRGATLAGVEAHLVACPRCRRELAALDRLDDTLATLPAIEPPPYVYERVLTRAAHARPSPFKRPLWALAVALAALAALIGGYDVLVVPHGVPLVGMRAAPRPMPATQPQVPSSASGNAPPIASAARSPLSAAQAPAAGGIAIAPHSALGPAKAAVPNPHADAPPLSPDARLIARTGEVDMRVADVRKAYTAVGGVAARAGGYVSDSNDDAAGTTGGAYAATLTLRVPAARFGDVMDKLAALPPAGGLLRERSGSQDITDNYHDLQARLQALQTTRTQLTAIMRKAGTISATLTVLDRLTDVNTSIDGVQGQIMAGANSVMFSTVTVNIAAAPHKQPVVAPTRRRPPPPVWRPGRDLANALSNLAAALRAVITVAIYAAVYLALPALLAALALLSRRLWRREPRGA